jgi:5-oxoprolinase (ATP-hydrolysing)
LEHLADVAIQALVQQGYEKSTIVVEKYINMRYEGTDNAIMIQNDSEVPFEQAFEACYQREFGFDHGGHGENQGKLVENIIYNKID